MTSGSSVEPRPKCSEVSNWSIRIPVTGGRSDSDTTSPSLLRRITTTSPSTIPRRHSGSWVVTMNWMRGIRLRMAVTIRNRQRGCRWAPISSISTIPSASADCVHSRMVERRMSQAITTIDW